MTKQWLTHRMATGEHTEGHPQSAGQPPHTETSPTNVNLQQEHKLAAISCCCLTAAGTGLLSLPLPPLYHQKTAYTLGCSLLYDTGGGVSGITPAHYHTPCKCRSSSMQAEVSHPPSIALPDRFRDLHYNYRDPEHTTPRCPLRVVFFPQVS